MNVLPRNSTQKPKWTKLSKVTQDSNWFKTFDTNFFHTQHWERHSKSLGIGWSLRMCTFQWCHNVSSQECCLMQNLKVCYTHRHTVFYVRWYDCYTEALGRLLEVLNYTRCSMGSISPTGWLISSWTFRHLAISLYHAPFKASFPCQTYACWTQYDSLTLFFHKPMKCIREKFPSSLIWKFSHPLTRTNRFGSLEPSLRALLFPLGGGLQSTLHWCVRSEAFGAFSASRIDERVTI